MYRQILGWISDASEGEIHLLWDGCYSDFCLGVAVGLDFVVDGVDAVEESDGPLGEDAGYEDGVFEVRIFLCFGAQVVARHEFVAEVSHLSQLVLRDV